MIACVGVVELVGLTGAGDDDVRNDLAHNVVPKQHGIRLVIPGVRQHGAYEEVPESAAGDDSICSQVGKSWKRLHSL